MRRVKTETDQPKKKRAPAKTLESRENQLISKAFDLAEKQMDAGTASSQVITEFLKRGSTRERLEKQKLVLENELTKAKTKSIGSQEKMEELYIKAITAMSRYGGHQNEEHETIDDIEE